MTDKTEIGKTAKAELADSTDRRVFDIISAWMAHTGFFSLVAFLAVDSYFTPFGGGVSLRGLLAACACMVVSFVLLWYYLHHSSRRVFEWGERHV